jgi:deoxyribodipyrimidine photo-lyase|tara:strand:+ start:6958 stop:8433 length:1476 start_codon:yes stop_codon:yes gene_type:complete
MSHSTQTNIVWLRSDLRLDDNPALSAAQSLGHPVQLVYYVHNQLWIRHSWGPAKIDFVKRTIQALAIKAAEYNLPLAIIPVDSTKDLADDLSERCKALHTKSVYLNREYPLDERTRDSFITKHLKKLDVSCEAFDDRMCIAPEKIKTGSDGVYKVFTPFKRCWYRHLGESGGIAKFSCITQSSQVNTSVHVTPLHEIEVHFSIFKQQDLSSLWPAGEVEANRRLNDFCQDHLLTYDQKRDIPSEAATSGLSPYFAVGSLSTRQCLLALLPSLDASAEDQLMHGGVNQPGASCWVSELIWREYYQYLMFHFSDLSKSKPFKLDTQWLPWRTGDAADRDFEAWCSGNTGFPIIDAAMRQLHDTGWMHNRLRMITAMFLTKHLLINWRRGEAYFSEKLIDLDFSSNNGGWQWSASTGCDAVPYFRIFNPVAQGQRFDAEGKFITGYFPDLIKLPKKQRHDPQSQTGYPAPIVNLKAGRERALAAFKELNNSSIV